MYKTYKRFLSMILAVATMFVFFVTPTGAENLSSKVNILTGEKEVIINEYQAFKELQSTSMEELRQNGYTEREISQIKSFNYRDALLERAQKSESELRAYGYTNSEIETLKSYLEGKPITEEFLLASSAQCTSKFESTSASSSSISLRYVWEWSKVPIYTLDDMVALRWQGVDDAGHELILRRGSSYCKVNYYYLLSGDKETTRNFSPEADPDFNAIHCGFYVMTSKFDPYTEAWAKSGELGVKLDKSGYLGINYINVAGKYGHATTTLGASIGVNYPNPALSISFTPETKVEELALSLYEITKS